MKILFTGEYSDARLVEAPLLVSRILFRQFKASGKEIIYLSYFQDGKKYSRFQKLFGCEAIDQEKQIYRCGIIPYLFLICRYKPDIVHFINFQRFYLLLIPLRYFLRFKIIYTMHGLSFYETKYFTNSNKMQNNRVRFTEYIILKYSDYIFALSKLTARFINIYYKVPRVRTIVVPNGIEIKPAIKKKYYNNVDLLKCLFIGDIDRRVKGFEFLIKAMSKGKIENQLTVFCSEQINFGQLNYDSNINLLMSTANDVLRKEIINYDLYLITSEYESFSLSLLEAMDAGLLFIASDRVGLTERFDEELRKLVYKHGSEASFLEKFNYVNKLSLVKKNEISDKIKKFASTFSDEYASIVYSKHYFQLSKK
jgi:glycosyltransferase involved in cell wall biosynthesis